MAEETQEIRYPFANPMGNVLGIQVTIIGMLRTIIRTKDDRLFLEQTLTQLSIEWEESLQNFAITDTQ